MKKTNYRLLCALVPLFLAPCAPAQEPPSPELRAFQEAAGDGSILFRGKQANVYYLPANGNPYWRSAEFTSGEIIFEGKRYYDILINIDAFEGTALVRLLSDPVTIALAPSTVESILLPGHRFIGVGPDSKALPEGFYEVFGDGPESVYKHVTKTLQTSIGTNVNGKLIGYEDENYNPELIHYYSISTTYYFRDSEGRISRLNGKNSLLSKFPDRRKEIRRALDNAGLQRSGVSFDAWCRGVLQAAAQ